MLDRMADNPTSSNLVYCALGWLRIAIFKVAPSGIDRRNSHRVPLLRSLPVGREDPRFSHGEPPAYLILDVRPWPAEPDHA